MAMCGGSDGRRTCAGRGGVNDSLSAHEPAPGVCANSLGLAFSLGVGRVRYMAMPTRTANPSRAMSHARPAPGGRSMSMSVAISGPPLNVNRLAVSPDALSERRLVVEAVYDVVVPANFVIDEFLGFPTLHVKRRCVI